MRKSILWILWAAILAGISCACGVQETPAPLSKTITAADGAITFLVPDNWAAIDKGAYDTDERVLTMTDNNFAYAEVYYYSYDEDYQALEDFVAEYTEYFGDDVLSDVTELEIKERKALKFEYSYEDLNEYLEDARFRGFIYLVDAPLGVICIDIYHTVADPSETEEVSTEKQRQMLCAIAESLNVSDDTTEDDMIKDDMEDNGSAENEPTTDES